MCAMRGRVLELVYIDHVMTAWTDPFPLAAEVISRRGESETAAHMSAAVQLVPVSVKLPVNEKPVVPEPLPTMALPGLMENAHADPVVIVVVSPATAGAEPPPLTVTWFVT